MSGVLEDRTVAVVGASGCHGAAVARALAREGASLVLGARSREPLQELQRELEESGTRAFVVGTDVTRQRHLERLVEVTLESLGALDALVYAARARPAVLESPDARSWGDSVDVNVRGFLYAVGAALPALQERGGHIVDLAPDAECGAQEPLERAALHARRTVREELEGAVCDRGVGVSGVPAGSPDEAPGEVCRILSRACGRR